MTDEINVTDAMVGAGVNVINDPQVFDYYVKIIYRAMERARRETQPDPESMEAVLRSVDAENKRLRAELDAAKRALGMAQRYVELLYGGNIYKELDAARKIIGRIVTHPGLTDCGGGECSEPYHARDAKGCIVFAARELLERVDGSSKCDA